MTGKNQLDDVLKPGSDIKPLVSVELCKNLVKDLYGLKCLLITELNGYDDLNFKISVDEQTENEYVSKVHPHGYVFKVLNSLDSQRLDLIDAQNNLMIYLEHFEISTPKLIRNRKGNLFSTENLQSGRHVVRLLEFIPGTILYQVPNCTNLLLFQVGQLAAKFDQTVKTFHHSAYDTYLSIWMLDSVPKLNNFLYAIKESEKRRLVEDIISAFNLHVLTTTDSLEKGVIHGDLNEQNLVAKKVTGTNGEKEWVLEGLLDFGDTQYSCYLYELAVAMTYMIILSKDLKAGGHVLAGYLSIRKVPQKEMSLLKICIAARMCQSLVLGAYTHSQDPSNFYVLTTAKVGWELLTKLWNTSEEDILNIWKVC